MERWTFEAPAARVQQHQTLPTGLRLADAAQRLAALQEHSLVVDLGERQTFFLPAIQGRLSLYELEDEPLEMDLSHDEEADPKEVARLLAAVTSR